MVKQVQRHGGTKKPGSWREQLRPERGVWVLGAEVEGGVGGR